VPRDGGPADLEGSGDLAGRELPVAHELEHAPARGVGDRCRYGFQLCVT
jgi:hypothetical protein